MGFNVGSSVDRACRAGEEDAVEELELVEVGVERKRCKVEALGKPRGRRKGRYVKAFVCDNAIVNKFV